MHTHTILTFGFEQDPICIQVHQKIEALGLYKVIGPNLIKTASFVCREVEVDATTTILFFPGVYLEWSLEVIRNLGATFKGARLGVVVPEVKCTRALEARANELGFALMQDKVLLAMLDNINASSHQQFDGEINRELSGDFLKFFNSLLSNKVSSHKMCVVSKKPFGREIQQALRKEGYETSLFSDFSQFLKKMISRGALGYALKTISCSPDLQARMLEIEDEELRKQFLRVIVYSPEKPIVIEILSKGKVELLPDLLNWLEGLGPLKGWVEGKELEILYEMAGGSSLPRDIRLPVVMLGTEFLEQLKSFPFLIPIIPIADIVREQTLDLVALYQQQIRSDRNVRRFVRLIKQQAERLA